MMFAHLRLISNTLVFLKKSRSTWRKLGLEFNHPATSIIREITHTKINVKGV